MNHYLPSPIAWHLVTAQLTNRAPISGQLIPVLPGGMASAGKAAKGAQKGSILSAMSIVKMGPIFTFSVFHLEKEDSAGLGLLRP